MISDGARAEKTTEQLIVTTEVIIDEKPTRTPRRRFPTTDYRIRPSLFSYNDDLGIVPQTVTGEERDGDASQVVQVQGDRDHSSFAGFYVAFWVMMATMVMQPLVQRWQNHEQVWNIKLARLSLARLPELVACEIVLNGITLSCVYIQKTFASGAISWDSCGWIMQSVFEATFLASWVLWLMFIDWPWPHSIFFILHVVVHLMKIHSYSFYNGYLSSVLHKLKSLPAVAPETMRKELESELVSPLGNVRYPANLTLANSWDWLLVPSVCYDLEFPRTPAVRWRVVLYRTVSLACAIVIFYLQVEFYTCPIVANAQAEYAKAVPPRFLFTARTILLTSLQLMFPMFLSILMAFFIIWELVLNTFAELTRFGDRLFYEDWWNSATQLEFARLWNTVVYRFLWRHVYRPIQAPVSLATTVSASRSTAARRRMMGTVVTFLVSSFFHELVASTSVRKFKLWIFTLQMFQIVINYFQALKCIRRHRTIGMVVGWVILVFGVAFNFSVYLVI